MTATHRLAELLDGAARGSFPKADWTVEVLPPPPGRAMAVVAFTARHVIATDAPEEWVRGQLPDGDLTAPMSPRFLAALGERLGRRGDGVDVVFAAPGLAGQTALRGGGGSDHPRVNRAAAHREDIRVFSDESGAATVVLGRGLALRNEVSIEVAEGRRGHGLGTRMLIEARRLIGPERVVFAQVAAGNAASLRAFLAAGFRPIASEVLFFGSA